MRESSMACRKPGQWLRSGRAWAILFLAMITGAAQVRAATPEQVEDSIRRGKEFLYRAQKNGNWEVSAGPEADDPPYSVKGGQWGGLTAIATYALLAAGDKPEKEPRLQAAIDWLKKANNINGTYALGMRAQIWQFLDPKSPGNKDIKEKVRLDAQLLAGMFKTQGPALGFCDYLNTGTTGRYDHSVSQYGVLGMWAVAQTDYIEIPQRFWGAVEEAWVRDQGTGGGWSYENKGTKPTASMTAAGVATLFITQDYLHSMEGIECIGNIKNPHLDSGIKWIADNFKEVNDNYTWYGIERIGVASGYKYFGTIDWFKEGADRLVRGQSKGGEWAGGHGGAVPNTSFALLFLVRGRAPVAINKLEYAIEGLPTGKAANWNQRSRDAAHFAHWLTPEMDNVFYNWQIVNLQVSVDDLHDSSILLVDGNQALNFSKEHEKKIREYLDGGGLIVFNGDCGMKARPFVESIMGGKSGPGLASKLGYDFEWRKLPEDHPIYKQGYARSKWKEANNLEVYALSNGSRELMILFTKDDPSRFWQTQTIGGREWAHQLMADILLYSTDKSAPRYKGQTYIVHARPDMKAEKTLKVARIQYAANWNPEPGGWHRLSNILHNEYKLDVTLEPLKLGEGKLDPKVYKLAHLTGNIKYHLGIPEKEELKKFCAGGGLLVVDACGGAAEYSDTVQNDLAEVLGEDADQLKQPINLDNPLFSAGGKKLAAENISYRTYAKRMLGNSQLHAPRLKMASHAGKPVCYFSAEDLSVGMVGQEVDGIYGYSPATATLIMEKIALQAAGIVAAPVPPKPEAVGRPAPAARSK